MKPTLDELAQKYDNDKATKKSDGIGHGYTPFYEKYFEPLRDSEIKLLEIGVAAGPSIQMWLDYFEKGDIHGLDITTNTNDWNSPGKEINLRYSFQGGDQSDVTMWACYLANSGKDFDIIVDDGGHYSGQIITSFQCLWDALKPGGLYCIEDLAAGMTVGTVFLTPGFPTHSQWLSTLQEKMHLGEGDIAEMHLSKELCIMRKRL